MAIKTAPSGSLAWWARGAQARRVAGMLSPRDAQIAETFAAECEDEARAASLNGLHRRRSAFVQRPIRSFHSPIGGPTTEQKAFARINGDGPDEASVQVLTQSRG
jgi:hypothetical protein